MLECSAVAAVLGLRLWAFGCSCMQSIPLISLVSYCAVSIYSSDLFLLLFLYVVCHIEISMMCVTAVFASHCVCDCIRTLSCVDCNALMFDVVHHVCVASKIAVL